MEWKIVGVLQYNVESDRIHQKWVEHFHYWRCSNFKQNINSFLTQMTKRSDCNLYFFRSNNLRDLGTVSQFYSQSTVISKFQNNLHTHYPVICNMFDVTWRREGSCCFFGGCQDMQLAKGMNMLSCYIYHTLLYSSACEELAWS